MKIASLASIVVFAGSIATFSQEVTPLPYAGTESVKGPGLMEKFCRSLGDISSILLENEGYTVKREFKDRPCSLKIEKIPFCYQESYGNNLCS